MNNVFRSFTRSVPALDVPNLKIGMVGKILLPESCKELKEVRRFTDITQRHGVILPLPGLSPWVIHESNRNDALLSSGPDVGITRLEAKARATLNLGIWMENVEDQLAAVFKVLYMMIPAPRCLQDSITTLGGILDVPVYGGV